MFDWLFGDALHGRKTTTTLSTGPQLCLITVADDFLALHNEGTTPARNVRLDPERSSIDIVSRADKPFDLAPGESWTFLIAELGPWTEAGWQVTVTWDDQEQPVCVPLPAGTL